MHDLFVNSARMGLWMQKWASPRDPQELSLSISAMAILFQQSIQQEGEEWAKIQTRLKRSGFKLFACDGSLWLRDLEGFSCFNLEDCGVTMDGWTINPPSPEAVQD